MDMGKHTGLALPKPESRKRVKGRKDRAEAAIKKAIRALCVEREVSCRVGTLHGPAWFDVKGNELFACYGLLEWAHMHTHRRSQTKGQAPEKRHTTAASLMLCTRHHDQYDGRATPRLIITRLSHKGANGPLKFRRGK